MRKSISIITGLLFCAAASAQDMALISSRISNDPSVLSMAGASSASSESISMSAFGNAAAMAFYKGKGELQASYNRWAPDGQLSNRFSFGEGMKFGKVMSVAIAGTYGTGQEYETIDDDGVSTGSFKTSDMMLGAAVGIAAGENFSIGLNARYASEKLYEDSSVSAFMADVSFMYHEGGLSISAGARSIGPKVHDQSERAFAIPSAANLAVYYGLSFAQQHSLGFGIDGNYFFNGGISAAAGIQYAWNDTVFARAGYHYGTKSAPLPQYLGLGLGAKFHGVILNLSYLTLNKSLGNTLCVGLGYSF